MKGASDMDYKVLENKWRTYGGEDAYPYEEMLGRDFAGVRAYHEALPGYEKTPLISYDDFADHYGIGEVYIKDESKRFGLNAFKGLGVSYACRNFDEPGAVYVSCTDGNHGKALAWFARETGHACEIFMPKGSERRRVEAIRAFGAKVTVTDMNYDDTVRYVAEYASENGFKFVQDTALDGYYEIPADIVMGYSTIISEAIEQMGKCPDHIFVQAGVGSLAGGAIWAAVNLCDERPKMGVIESSAVPCIYKSIESQRFVAIGGEPYTIMAGLNCGEANRITLPLIAEYADWLISCDDEVTERGMKRAGSPIGKDPVYSAGESGAVGIGFLESLLLNGDAESFGIDGSSVVLVINSEGVLEDR